MAIARGNHPALIFEDQQLSYKELEERSNQVAALLQAKGVNTEAHLLKTAAGIVSKKTEYSHGKATYQHIRLIQHGKAEE